MHKYFERSHCAQQDLSCLFEDDTACRMQVSARVRLRHAGPPVRQPRPYTEYSRAYAQVPARASCLLPQSLTTVG